MYQLAHHVLEAGSSRGAAFPSSHVGVSAAQAVNAFVLLPWLAPFVALLVAALAAGAVYGGFHYAIDASTGLLLGLAAAFAAPAVRRALTGERP
jgi:membrane-associated phospholipid phosphatase